MDGVINVYKPEGWTSQDVCAKLRSRLHIKKIGHTGTLDPMATGVLPVCIGKATRIIEYYDQDMKSYHASMQLGITTDTLDITGEILKRGDYSDVNENAVREAFKAHTGTIEQIPPKFSALRVGGKRAYELAREGKEFELKTRKIEVFKNDISSIDLEKGIIEFDVNCSKGTYIRTIIDDIGRELGCGAAMTALERSGSGYFTLDNAIALDTLVNMSDDEIAKCVIPMDETLVNLGTVILNDNRITAFVNGNNSRTGSYKVVDSHIIKNPSSHNKLPLYDYYRVYAKKDNTFLGIGRIENKQLIPNKVLF